MALGRANRARSAALPVMTRRPRTPSPVGQVSARVAETTVDSAGKVVGDDRLGAWVAASCARHGVPVRVTDALVVARVAVLLGDTTTPARAPLAVVAGLQAPDRVGPVRVELAGARETGGDHDVIDDGGDDRVLPGQAELGPLTA